MFKRPLKLLSVLYLVLVSLLHDRRISIDPWLRFVEANNTRNNPLILASPSPRRASPLAFVEGHRYVVECPCSVPVCLIRGQKSLWSWGAPVHGLRTQGPTLDFLLFKALGRLIGLLSRAPLWGSTQACSSCWVCRRWKGVPANSSAGQFVCFCSAYSLNWKGYIKAIICDLFDNLNFGVDSQLQ